MVMVRVGVGVVRCHCQGLWKQGGYYSIKLRLDVNKGTWQL